VREKMNRQQFSLIISTLLIVFGLPWLAHSQFGGGGGGSGGMSAGGGLGDMGGGGIGGLGSGMGGYGGEHIVYTRPEGPPPSWLVSGLASVKASEELRKLLNERFDVETSHEDLNTTIAYLREMGIDVEVDSKGLQSNCIMSKAFL
jgi:hypothetical protein